MATDTSIPKYEMRIYWSEEDDAYLVEVPDLPGCMAHGVTPSEAATMGQEAITAWVECAREDRVPLPTPRRDRASA